MVLRMNIRVLVFALSFSFVFASLWLYLRRSPEWSHTQKADPLGKTPRSADEISAEEFAEEYISLSDKVNELQMGEGPVGSLLHYLRPSKKDKVRKYGIFIAVVTTGKYLRTRARAIFQTWAKDVPESSRLSFFVGEDCDISDPSLEGMPIIRVNGIRDDIYPPQRKVFAILRYIHIYYGDQFKWFIRADDDVYVRVRALEEMLYNFDWTKLLFLGHPGRGKKKDRRRLKLLSHENYCMGGPGVVFSAATLEALVPYLYKCLLGLDLYNQQRIPEEGWYNEDVELGRCVSRTLGIGCTGHPWSDNANVGESFFHIYDISTLNLSTLWSNLAFVNAVTVHPVKNQDHLFRLHHFYKLLDYKALSSHLDHAAGELRHLCARLPAHFKSNEFHSEHNKGLIFECFQYNNG